MADREVTDEEGVEFGEEEFPDSVPITPEDAMVLMAYGYLARYIAVCGAEGYELDPSIAMASACLFDLLQVKGVDHGSAVKIFARFAPYFEGTGDLSALGEGEDADPAGVAEGGHDG